MVIDRKTGFVYQCHENQISARLGFTIPYPIRVFGLRGLGVDQLSFIRELAPTFSMLNWDQYDVKRGQVAVLKDCFPKEHHRLDAFLVDYYAGRSSLQGVGDLIRQMSLADRWKMERVRPRRKRSIAKFVLHYLERWHVERIPAQSFAQNAPSEAGDIRALVRIFDEADDFVAMYSGVRHLLECVADMVKEFRPGVKELTVTMHQVCIFAELEFGGDNSPEGIHQDGSDYIVSAFVVERDGILGGESVVYGPDKKTEYIRHTLLPGQGLFQADKGTSLWHYVTPIREDPATPPTYGKRSIFGFDVDVTKEN